MASYSNACKEMILEKPWLNAGPICPESGAVYWQRRKEEVSSLDFPTHPLSLGLGEHT